MKRFKLYTLVILLTVLFTTANAQTKDPVGGKPIAGQLNQTVDPTPGIQLKAPLTCDVGELVRFDARDSEVDSLVWDTIPATNDFEVVGLRAFFSARSGGEYRILIAGAKDGKAFLVHQKITVKGVAATLTGLTGKIDNWLGTVPKDMPGRKDKLLAMAGVFRKLSQGDIDTDKILESTALANSAILADTIASWAPFLDKLGTELDDMIDDRKLEDAGDYRKTWAEIARGLEINAKKVTT